MWTWRFWRQALERAVKTASQFALVFFGGDAFNILEIDLVAAGGYTLAGVVVSILTSVASEPYHQRGSPSMVSQ